MREREAALMKLIKRLIAYIARDHLGISFDELSPFRGLLIFSDTLADYWWAIESARFLFRKKRTSINLANGIAIGKLIFIFRFFRDHVPRRELYKIECLIMKIFEFPTSS